MKVKSSGRNGYHPYQPESRTLSSLIPATTGLKQQVLEYCDGRNLTSEWLEDWDEDELAGLTAEMAVQNGLTKPHATRLVAKIKGILKNKQA